MRIKKNYIWIGAVCLLLGVMIALQAKYVNTKYLNGAKIADKSAVILAELNQVKTERENLLKEIEQLEKQLDDIKNSASRESILVKNLNAELEKYRTFSGFTKLSGAGIIVSVDNPPKLFDMASDKNIAIDYRYILDLVNELQSSSAEAVSINDQRLVGNTEIRLAGSQMNVNNIPLSPPFIIKAIGNPDTLDGGISQRFGIIQTLREDGYYVEVRKEDAVDILPFTGTIQFKYGSVVK